MIDSDQLIRTTSDLLLEHRWKIFGLILLMFIIKFVKYYYESEALE